MRLIDTKGIPVGLRRFLLKPYDHVSPFANGGRKDRLLRIRLIQNLWSKELSTLVFHLCFSVLVLLAIPMHAV